MFQWLWSFLRWIGILQQKRAQVVIVGLDNAGKTTLLHTMQTHHFAQFEPTKDHYEGKLEFGGIIIACIDLGGHSCVRQNWTQYYSRANGLVFVIDASDQGRIPEAKQELDQILNREELLNVPILILGNKQDVVGCLSREELQEKLAIKTMSPLEGDRKPGERLLRIQMISAKQDFGYEVGFNWLARMM